MTNEEKILELLMQMQSDITDLKAGQQLLKDNFVNLENNLVPKVAALFDAFELRGDQLSKLETQMNNQFNTLKLDITYMLNKVVQHETRFSLIEHPARQG